MFILVFWSNYITFSTLTKNQQINFKLKKKLNFFFKVASDINFDFEELNHFMN